jgi:hypothetical protein
MTTPLYLSIYLRGSDRPHQVIQGLIAARAENLG